MHNSSYHWKLAFLICFGRKNAYPCKEIFCHETSHSIGPNVGHPFHHCSPFVVRWVDSGIQHHFVQTFTQLKFTFFFQILQSHQSTRNAYKFRKSLQFEKGIDKEIKLIYLWYDILRDETRHCGCSPHVFPGLQYSQSTENNKIKDRGLFRGKIYLLSVACHNLSAFASFCRIGERTGWRRSPRISSQGTSQEWIGIESVRGSQESTRSDIRGIIIWRANIFLLATISRWKF